jgi:hypothetical protein
MQKQETLNTAMGSYAARLSNSRKPADNALALGRMTTAQIEAHTGKEGEVVLETDRDGNAIGYAVFTGGRFVSAY